MQKDMKRKLRHEKFLQSKHTIPASIEISSLLELEAGAKQAASGRGKKGHSESGMAVD